MEDLASFVDALHRVPAVVFAFVSMEYQVRPKRDRLIAAIWKAFFFGFWRFDRRVMWTVCEISTHPVLIVLQEIEEYQLAYKGASRGRRCLVRL